MHPCIHRDTHCHCRRGLLGPSKGFRDLRIQVRFSGDTRLYRSTKFAYCSTKPPSYVVSRLLLCSYSRILDTFIFKVHKYWLCRVWDGVDGLVHKLTRSASDRLLNNNTHTFTRTDTHSPCVFVNTLTHMFSEYGLLCISCIYTFITNTHRHTRSQFYVSLSFVCVSSRVGGVFPLSLDVCLHVWVGGWVMEKGEES